ncbi:HNH endonuclease [Tsukamurella sp. NPDC003166]|uniref:HNH endonuclease n=1 Tax=Tsukamurella sp. NPDC003166 TaxID=3154444 RepID=UPI0033A70D29
MFDDATDLRLRLEAMDFLRRVTNDQEHPVTREMLLHDFTFDGEPFKLIDPTRGIRKPRQLQHALTIMTSYKTKSAFNYSDEIGEDGFLRYSWKGVNPNDADNVGLRSLIGTHKPLTWFFGVAPGELQAIFPVYVVGEEPADRRFVVAFADTAEMYRPDSPVEAAIRRYVTREVKTRVHQPVFRSRVLRAYENHCAVCNLNHRELLDASHIIPDSEAGKPIVSNGLSLCKIHHRAYDVKILGITPDYQVKIRGDILDEIDGPMLEYGLKKLHDGKLMFLPSRRTQRPSPELLSVQYKRFLCERRTG